MIGLERDTREEQPVAAPAMANPVAATPATGVEVAGLRERMDGVSLKLDAVDRRVGALEAARHDDVAPIQDDPSEKSLPASEQSDARATGTSAEGKRAIPVETSGRRSDSSSDTSPASSGGRVDAPPGVPAPAPTSVVLMLSDGQFEKWLGRGAPSPIDLAEQELADDEPHTDRRLRQNAGRRTRR